MYFVDIIIVILLYRLVWLELCL